MGVWIFCLVLEDGLIFLVRRVVEVSPLGAFVERRIVYLFKVFSKKSLLLGRKSYTAAYLLVFLLLPSFKTNQI
jgi:hypothetical protein